MPALVACIHAFIAVRFQSVDSWDKKEAVCVADFLREMSCLGRMCGLTGDAQVFLFEPEDYAFDYSMSESGVVVLGSPFRDPHTNAGSRTGRDSKRRFDADTLPHVRQEDIRVNE